jgi:hypothetical protein
MSNSKNILSAQSHPGDSSPQDVVGDPYKGDGFYGRSDGIHTAQYSVVGFIGTVVIQASLETSPGALDWFTVTESAHTSAAADSNEGDGSFIKNFTGNYVWVRATITNWTDGTVSSVLLNH